MIYSALRAILLVSALGLTTLAPSLFPPDVSGVWKVDFANEAATETVMVNLKQENSTLTGHYMGYYDVAQLAGSLDGKEIAFSYDIDGTMINLFGRLKGNVISGSYHAGDYEQGEFVATRVN
jgi:hypothetical protein